MALSFTQSVGDGTTRNFPVQFPYLSKAHVQLFVDGVQQPFTWLNPGMIRADTAPPVGSVVTAQRVTPRDTILVDFVDGSTLTETDLDTATLQTFFLSQEAFDLSNANLGLKEDGAFSAFNRRISDLGTPTDPADAVTKQWAETGMSSQLTQATTARTEAQTARDVTLGARDETLAARDVTLGARDETVAARDTTNGHRLNASNAKTAAEAARDVTLAARDVTVDARNEAETFRNQAAQSAADAVLFDPSTYWTKAEADDRFVSRSAPVFNLTGGITGSITNLSSTTTLSSAWSLPGDSVFSGFDIRRSTGLTPVGRMVWNATGDGTRFAIGVSSNYSQGITDIPFQVRGDTGGGPGFVQTAQLKAGRSGQGNFINAGLEVNNGAQGGGAVFISLHALGSSAVQIRHIPGNASIDYVNADSSLFVPAVALSFNAQSDYRTKTDIEAVNPLDAASLVKALKPVWYTPKSGSNITTAAPQTPRSPLRTDTAIGTKIGFIAHEAQEVVPEAVQGEKDATSPDGTIIPQSVDYGRITPLLTAALQEALSKIEALEARIESLENRDDDG